MSKTKAPKKQKVDFTRLKSAAIGVIFLTLKVSLGWAGVVLWKLPAIHVVVDIPLHQIFGTVLLLFLVWLELFDFLINEPVRRAARVQPPRDTLGSFKMAFEDMPERNK